MSYSADKLADAFYLRAELKYTGIISVIDLLLWRGVRLVPELHLNQYFQFTDVIMLVGALGVFTMATLYPLSKVNQMRTRSFSGAHARTQCEHVSVESASTGMDRSLCVSDVFTLFRISMQQMQ